MPIADVRREFARVQPRSIGLLEQAIHDLQARLAEPEPKASPSSAPQEAELIALKPTFWGITFNVNEAWRRLRRWRRTGEPKLPSPLRLAKAVIAIGAWIVLATAGVASWLYYGRFISSRTPQPLSMAEERTLRPKGCVQGMRQVSGDDRCAGWELHDGVPAQRPTAPY
jgi:hypothetical protein